MFILNIVFVAIEVVGGLMTGRFAILTDALHDFGDTLSLGVSWYLEGVSKRVGMSVSRWATEDFLC